MKALKDLTKNESLFNKIATINEYDLKISLDPNYLESLDEFRELTSRIRTLNHINYPVVYLSENDFGGLTITYNSTGKLRLIVNLQFYYVYGFYLDDGNVYAFQGPSEQALKDFGFDCITIPYGDGYFDIKKVLGETAFNDLLNTDVTLYDIVSSLNQVANPNIAFSDKSRALLITLWSMAEGIRFSGISNVINKLLGQEYEDKTYSMFYNLAEVWSELCITAANEKTLNPDIAVYDLDRIK